MQPTVRVIEHGDKPSQGFVRRPNPVFPEFVIHASWWPVQEWEKDGQEDGMVFLWIPRSDNVAYNKFVARKRFCPNYQRVQKSCNNGKRYVKVPTC